MRIRKVRVGVKDIATALNEFVELGKAIEMGKPVKKEKGVYFTSIEAFRKAITPKRLALLRAIKTRKPLSVSHLSDMVGRDAKNVSADVRFLEQVGFIDIRREEKIERGITPFVTYDKIMVEIAVS